MSQIISLIAALVILAAAIIGARGDLPWWVVLITALIFAGWVIGTFYSRLKTAIRGLLRGRRAKKLAWQHWGELRRLAAELRKMTESNTTEMVSTVYNLWRDS